MFVTVHYSYCSPTFCPPACAFPHPNHLPVTHTLPKYGLLSIFFYFFFLLSKHYEFLQSAVSFYELGIIFLSLLKTLTLLRQWRKEHQSRLMSLCCAKAARTKKKKRSFCICRKRKHLFFFTRIGLLNEKSSKERKEQ